MPSDLLDGHISTVRAFSRFYTQRIGVLDEGILRSPFSLTEGRIIFEMAQRSPTTATVLTERLDLDPGYLSRILARFLKKGLIARKPAVEDARRQDVILTPKGRKAFDALNSASQRDIEAMLRPLGERQQRRLVDAMRAIHEVLDRSTRPSAEPTLRHHRPGDMGWVVQRHGELYSIEYGWDERFEGLIARIVADFIDNFDGTRERCWIAEHEGQRVGSVFVVRDPDRDGVAKLRLLLVEPDARGLGIGRRLVHECARFARESGYRTLSLWTNDVLHAARRIYQAEGYHLVREEAHHSFGQDLIAQTWELDLADAPGDP